MATSSPPATSRPRAAPARRVARWDGTAWTPFGAGTDRSVEALAFGDDGTLALGGGFTTAGGGVSVSFARLQSPCPASAMPFGAACASSGGSSTLAALSLPWASSTFHVRGTGLPALALVATAAGVTAINVPLPLLLAQGVPGCALFAAPDVVTLQLAQAGAAQWELAVPGTLTLAGLAFHCQMVSLELDLQLQLVAATSTNALTATLGAW